MVDAGGRRRVDTGLQAHATAKIAEIDQRIADLTVIRDALGEAIDAGCDDLVACADSPGCPLPLTDGGVDRPNRDRAGA